MAVKRKLNDLTNALATLNTEDRESEQQPSKSSGRNLIKDRSQSERALSQGRRRTAAQYLIEPEKCRMWKRHNRFYDLLTPGRCEELIDDIRAKGQLTPAIARPLRDNPEGYEYEIVAGARRHFAIAYLRREESRRDLLYRIEVREMDDEEAFLASDAENRGREDISDYEKALDYSQALADFYGGNVKAMSERIGMPRTSLTHYLNLSKLPEEIVAAFPDPTEIALRTASKLSPLLGKEHTRSRVIEEAVAIQHLQREATKVGTTAAIPSADVTKRLLDAGANEKPRRAPAKIRKIEDSHGLVCEVEHGRKYVTFRVPVARAGDASTVAKEVRKQLSVR